MPNNNLNNTIVQYKIIRELQDKIGHFRSESMMDLFKRYQKIKTPELPSEILKLRCFTPEWNTLFHEESKNIRALLGPDITHKIEHIGSTAIKGQSSNHMIDIALIVKHQHINEVQQILVESGYADYGNSPLSTKAKWFWKIDTDRSFASVLHLDEEENVWFDDTLNFRDFLNQHNEELTRYNKLKESIANLKKENILLYSLKKIELTCTITSQANKWKHSLSL
jgi:GrpB-like predicted nucleotidyltransferase (UPF0157 family)